MRAALLAIVLAGCSNILGIDNLHGPNGSGSDAATDTLTDGKPPPDVIVGAHLTVSGTVLVVVGTNQQPAGDHPVAVVRTSDGVVLGSATTDQTAGAFSITIATNAMPVDAHLRIDPVPNIPGELPSTVYFARPLTGDKMNVSVTMLTQQAISNLALVGGAQQQASLGFAAAFVLDTGEAPEANATVTTEPNLQIRYADANSLPSSSLTSTTSRGLAMIFNVPTGTLNASATVLTLPFGSQTIDVPTLGVFYLTLQP